jgi:hypothetical protein
MDSQALRILRTNLVEVQELIYEQTREHQLVTAGLLWELQLEKAERLKDGIYYSESNHRGTEDDPKGNGKGS